MKNTTMLEVAIKAVSEDKDASLSFHELFEKVEEELKDTWYFKFVKGNPDMSYDKIRETKMGELFRLLTVDKRFHRNLDGTWQSRAIEIN